MENNLKIRILFVGTVLTGNKGATAMAIGTRQILERSFKGNNLEFSILTPYYDNDLPFIEKYGFVKIYRYKNLLRCSLPKLFKQKLGFKEADDDVLAAYKNADLIIDVSGITFCDTFGLYTSAINPVAYICLAWLLKKPIVKFTQSFGPITRLATKWLGKFFLSRCLAVIAREEGSIKWLNKLKLKNVYMCVDSAFDMKLSQPEGIDLNQYKQNQEIILGICPNQLIGRKTESYLKLMEKIINLATEELGARVMILPHYSLPSQGQILDDGEYDDFKIARKLKEMAKCQDKILFWEREFLPQELKYLIGQCDCFVGSRYHSLVAAISTEVPSMAIGWNHKYQGIFKRAGIEEYVLDYENLSWAEVENKLRKLFKNKVEIKGILHSTHEGMVNDSYQAGEILKTRYGKNS